MKLFNVERQVDEFNQKEQIKIHITRGVRQVCSLSPILFNVFGWCY